MTGRERRTTGYRIAASYWQEAARLSDLADRAERNGAERNAATLRRRAALARRIEAVVIALAVTMPVRHNTAPIPAPSQGPPRGAD